MPNKCGVVNCRGNYNSSEKCRVFRLPSDELQRQRWLSALPPREGFDVDPSKFFICERHWPADAPTKTIPGGRVVPTIPPSIFAVPKSCLPTPKPSPWPRKVEDQQLRYFLAKDQIKSFADFNPDKDLMKTYKNIVVSRTEGTFICVFMLADFSDSYLSVLVHNAQTLTSPLTFCAFKDGIKVPFGKSKILHPNNGLSSFSQFFEAVRYAKNYCVPAEDIVRKVTKSLLDIQSYEGQSMDSSKKKKLEFFTRQLQLLHEKKFSVADYCFAVESFPRCSYHQLREFLVLPSKRKIQGMLSSTDIDTVLEKTFNKIQPLQKNCLLLVDEVKIRPTVSFSSGVLNGMAKNNPESKASSMLCVMMKCVHGGPSVMVSVTPVHKLTALYQFSIVKDAATVIERCGGIVLGSITDNHKINQQYCKLFKRITDCEGVHPLDETRVWYLLFDTVHLLKCIRNNWITEKCQKLSLDKKCVGSFSDIKALYLSEKDSVLKSTPLNCAAVFPSRLQLQNVQHVLHVFNDRVVAALRLRGAHESADFVKQILDWWNIVNVSGKGQDKRLRDLNRSVQDENTANLQPFLEMFEQCHSGQGPTRSQSLTHDTRKALVQTMRGFIALCKHLLSGGFSYVLLREFQSDRIEGEFSVYRQSTGANAYMQAGDVFSAFKQRLAHFSASFLESLETESQCASQSSHTCSGVELEDARIMEICAADVTLSAEEEHACAYVAGWLERKCRDKVTFTDEEPVLENGPETFVEEVSRGYLSVPHACTYAFVKTGLCFIRKATHKVCCRNRMMDILSIINAFYDFGEFPKCLLRRLSNVLLHGLHNLEKDHQRNAILYQTSIKKARLAE